MSKEWLAHRGLASFLCLPTWVSPCSGAGMMGRPHGSPDRTQGIPGFREVSGIQGWQRIQNSGDHGQAEALAGMELHSGSSSIFSVSSPAKRHRNSSLEDVTIGRENSQQSGQKWILRMQVGVLSGHSQGAQRPLPVLTQISMLPRVLLIVTEQKPLSRTADLPRNWPS